MKFPGLTQWWDISCRNFQSGERLTREHIDAAKAAIDERAEEKRRKAEPSPDTPRSFRSNSGSRPTSRSVSRSLTSSKKVNVHAVKAGDLARFGSRLHSFDGGSLFQAARFLRA